MIDMRTVIFSYAISNAVCMVVVALLWIRNRRHFTGLGLWFADFVMQFFMVLLVPTRGVLPDVVSIVLANTLGITGSILLLIGLGHFVNKRSSQWHNYILLAVFIYVHAYFTFIQPSLLIRVINFSAALILVLLQGAWLTMWGVEPGLRQTTRGVGYVFLLVCLVAVVRVIVDLNLDPGNEFLNSGLYDTLYVLANQMLFIVLTFSLFLMVNRRLVTEMELDLAHRKTTEEALIVSQKLAEKLYESVPAALVTVNAEGRITRVNSQAEAMFGYTHGELLNQSLDVLIPHSLRVRHKEHSIRYYSNPRLKPMSERPEISAIRKNGHEFPAEIGLNPFQVDEETFVTADIHDITERKQMNQALQYRTNVMEALNQVTLDLINRHEMDDILQTLLMKISALLDAADISFDLVENGDTLVTYAVTSNQPLKQGDRMPRGEGGWLSWQAIDSGEATVLEDYSTWPQRRALYEGYPIHAIMIAPIYQRDCVIGAINISRREAHKPFNDTDIYVAKQLAQMVALVLDNAQLYSQLQSELMESVRREGTLHEAQAQVIEQQRAMAMIDERQRMARDLHDSVNQSIHSLMLFSETLVSTLDRNNIARARQISERLQESARQALKETRLLLYQTQVTGQERGVDLIEELNARLANVEGRAGVRAQIIQKGSLAHCPKDWHQNIFWIAIEALNNSLKHSQARAVQVVIRSFPNYMELEVADDGRGYETTKPQTGGYGLRNMQERADLLGGRVTITSTPAKGTRVLFHADIKE